MWTVLSFWRVGICKFLFLLSVSDFGPKNCTLELINGIREKKIELKNTSEIKSMLYCGYKCESGYPESPGK